MLVMVIIKNNVVIVLVFTYLYVSLQPMVVKKMKRYNRFFAGVCFVLVCVPMGNVLEVWYGLLWVVIHSPAPPE